MKRVVFFLTFLVMSLVCFGQTESEHLKFMGIPLEGSLSNFTNKLKAKGFKETTEGPNLLIGYFAGIADCHIFITCFNNTNQVESVTVAFPVSESWSDLSTKFSNIKMMLTEKYGEPFDEHEEFEDPYIDDSLSKFREARLGKINFKSTFNIENGFAFLKIESRSIGCYVALYYFDKSNLQKAKSEALDDL